MIEVRDDRVLLLTRWSAAVLVLALLAGGITLYGFPGATAEVWAWPIVPDMTALVMGAGYLTSAFFFGRILFTRHWHTVEVGLLGVMLFAVLLLVATILHWGRFTHEHPVFWLWLALYVVAPLLVPTFWARNRRHADPAPQSPTVPRPVRLLLGFVGAVELVVALVFFAAPSVAAAVWPWMLTPLTTRVLAGFIAANAMTLLVFWWEARWTALSAGLQTVAIGIILIMLAVPRATGDFSGPVAMGVFLGALAVALVITAVPLVAVRSASPTSTRSDTSGRRTGQVDQTDSMSA